MWANHRITGKVMKSAGSDRDMAILLMTELGSILLGLTFTESAISSLDQSL